jgi:hypothetical protein
VASLGTLGTRKFVYYPRKSRDLFSENGLSVSILKSTGRKDLYENVFVVAVLLETEHS